MHKARRVAAALAAAASVTTVVGSALPLFSVTIDMRPSTVVLTMSAWSMEVTGAENFGGVPGNGYPLVFAAALLLFAAVRCRSATLPRAVRFAGVVTAVGAAFLACAVWMVVLQVVSWADPYGEQETEDGFSMGGEVSYPAGLWVLVVAAVLGVAAAVCALLPAEEPAPVPPEPVDPDAPTPPFGIAIPVPADEVDPLTGEPIGSRPDPPEPDPPPAVPEAPPRQPLSAPAIPLTDDPLAEPRGE